MNGLKTLLVDDSPEFLEVAADFLSRHSLVEVVGTARSGRQALALADELSPDLVLMDFSMPEMNGLEAIRSLKVRAFPPQVIMITLHSSEELSSLAKAAGADGFVVKSDFADSLLPLIAKLFPAVEVT
ncbi:MAG TPA: response regulator transcription factor [Verrucomicrobiae bacterium]|jgi:DNA-binding NarL/FixJ family response regulator|nr:response regulator transcription factor [Verrucomicrobiae bacterium]